MGVHTEREKELASRSKSPHLGKKSTDEVRVGPRRGTRGVDRTRNAGQLQESQCSPAPERASERPQRGAESPKLELATGNRVRGGKNKPVSL